MTLKLTSIGLLENQEKKEREILDSKLKNNLIMLIPYNKKYCKIKKPFDTLRKRRIDLFPHIFKMNGKK